MPSIRTRGRYTHIESAIPSDTIMRLDINSPAISTHALVKRRISAEPAILPIKKPTPRKIVIREAYSI
ncbi:hypothetical protein D3C81_2240440 [compost metagenome]